jgi:hypothetical protein
MAGDATDLTFVLDENLGGPHIPEVLRIGKARPEGRITNLIALGIERGMDDENWMPKLGAMGYPARGMEGHRAPPHATRRKMGADASSRAHSGHCLLVATHCRLRGVCRTRDGVVRVADSA